MRVMLVEDDHVLAQGIARTLRGVGMTVEQLSTGEAVVNMASFAHLDIIVLDIGLPGIDGFEVVRRLRQRKAAVPILLLTARNAIGDRVRGLEVGGDDYLVKPFATPELIARVNALVRRSNPAPTEMMVGDLVLNTISHRATVGSRTIDLSVREWAVLEYLMQHTDKVVSKQQIIDAIMPWGGDLSDNAVEVYVSRIRGKLDHAGVSIRTIRGYGYLFEQEATI